MFLIKFMLFMTICAFVLDVLLQIALKACDWIFKHTKEK